jgi:hypothetical protein
VSLVMADQFVENFRFAKLTPGGTSVRRMPAA